MPMSFRAADSSKDSSVTLREALGHAAKTLGSKEFAIAVIKKGIGGGDLNIVADAVLTEYASGKVRPLASRRKNLQIDLKEADECTSLIIDKNYLQTGPNGAQLLGNWTKSDIVWIAPFTSKFVFSKILGKPMAVLPIRRVMYNVKIKRSELEKLVNIVAARHKIRESSLEGGKRQYIKDEDYSLIYKDLLLFAERGELFYEYRLDRWGSQAKLIRNMVMISNDKVKPRNAKRYLSELLKLDIRVRSDKIAEQLTNAN